MNVIIFMLVEFRAPDWLACLFRVLSDNHLYLTSSSWLYVKPWKLVLFFWEPVMLVSGVFLMFSFKKSVSMLRVSSGPDTTGLYGGFTFCARRSTQLMFLKKECSYSSFSSVAPSRFFGFRSSSYVRNSFASALK